MKKKILIVVGTRPNFIKVTRFKKEVEKYSGLEVKIVHTGQHYDSKMADVFFEQFKLTPDFFLNISPGSPNHQIGNIIIAFDKLIENTYSPDIILVPGDVNSTLACSIVANKRGIKLGHLESGLRSFDNTMPEEINRIVTDTLSDYYFVTERSGVENLSQSTGTDQIYHVGNTMIDTMVHYDEAIDKATILKELNLVSKDYILFTFHRPSNVDREIGLIKLVGLIEMLSEKYKIVFPIHPRTISQLKNRDLFSKLEKIENLILTDPMGYFEFQKLIKYCGFVITDSGGIQEETTFRQVPCITVRPNTERPITVSEGTNTLVEFDNQLINKIVGEIEKKEYKKGQIPEFWDGKATERIVKVLNGILA